MRTAIACAAAALVLRAALAGRSTVLALVRALLVAAITALALRTALAAALPATLHAVVAGTHLVIAHAALLVLV